jgi:dTDP-4-dehydrorhamnose 3,5-epimerase-like enzyme
VFWIRDVPPDAVRGDHANARTNKIIVAISGSVEISTTDSNAKVAHFTLNSPRLGLYVPHHFLNRMRNFAPGTVILVLADQPYDPQELIPSGTLSVN